MACPSPPLAPPTSARPPCSCSWRWDSPPPRRRRARRIRPATLRLTVDEAVRLALENNPDLKADRIDPQISDTRVAAAAGAFKPTFNTSLQRNDQLQPPAGFLTPAADHQQRLDHQRRHRPAPAVVRHQLQRGVERDAYREQQLPQQLQPAGAVRPHLQRLAAAAPRSARRHARGSSSSPAGSIATSPARGSAKASCAPPPT